MASTVNERYMAGVLNNFGCFFWMCLELLLLKKDTQRGADSNQAQKTKGDLFSTVQAQLVQPARFVLDLLMNPSSPWLFAVFHLNVT